MTAMVIEHPILTAQASNSTTKRMRLLCQSSLIQSNVGFKKSIILNEAVAKSTGDYLIFLDGDCIPFPDFLYQHRLLRENGYLIPKPAPKFAHSASFKATKAGKVIVVIGSYHPSQQNTFTGKLTEKMLSDVIAKTLKARK